jgi:fatty-acyl-CoA synthase
MVNQAVSGFESYEHALQGYPAIAVDPSAGDTMLYSSGTTGRPKGIKRELGAGVFGKGTNEPPLFSSYGFDTNTVYLCPAPLYHAAPLGFTLATVIRGGSVVVMEKFDPLQALELIEKHAVTHSQWVPTMFVRMLKMPLSERIGFDLSSHRCAIHAAAPCPIDVKREMIAWWGPIIDEYYSATERVGVTRIDSADWLKHPGSVGRPIAGSVLHICAEDGRKAPAGESGLIYFEQPAAGFAYHNAPEQTAASRHPAHPTWVTVGDIGRVDEDGYLYLTDRKSFVIISGGVNIYPQAIEDAIIMHPAVGDVAVIGVPDPDMGEAVKAVVELRPGIEACSRLAEEIISFTRERVARYSVPRSIDFVDRLPRSPSGKLFKKTLQDSYWHRAPSSATQT